MICSNCEMNIAERSPHHRCRADVESCIDGEDCPDFIEQCDCFDCHPFDEEHDRYYALEVY